ncbi:unnamed protein product [Xylocopa violacea]|uniref:Uncharacterized protein n=1 Tax=Xylocopa violacea TaxID=135666 RepID=A0ABP1MXZ0_XYLVO
MAMVLAVRGRTIEDDTVDVTRRTATETSVSCSGEISFFLLLFFFSLFFFVPNSHSGRDARNEPAFKLCACNFETIGMQFVFRRATPYQHTRTTHRTRTHRHVHTTRSRTQIRSVTATDICTITRGTSVRCSRRTVNQRQPSIVHDPRGVASESARRTENASIRFEFRIERRCSRFPEGESHQTNRKLCKGRGEKHRELRAPLFYATRDELTSSFVHDRGTRPSQRLRRELSFRDHRGWSAARQVPERDRKARTVARLRPTGRVESCGQWSERCLPMARTTSVHAPAVAMDARPIRGRIHRD